VALNVFDSDVHPYPRTSMELVDYTPEPWRTRDYGEFEPASKATAQVYPSPHGHGSRVDALPPTGGPAASDPDFAAKQLFEHAGVDYAMLIPLGPRPQANPERDLAHCVACNDWLAATWLSKYNTEGVFRGTLRVPTGDPELAVREVERWAGHPGFVQVMLDPGHQVPLGQPQYHKLYEVCAKNNLIVALHPIKGAGQRFLTPVGFPSYFMDQHSQWSHNCAVQLVSLVFEGVFDKFPTLKVAMVEGGVTWVLPMLWRMDKYWKELRHEVPWVKRRPSEWIRERVRFTTQPFEDPGRIDYLERIFDYIEQDEFFMFSTDYPHWDADDPQWIVRHVPERYRNGILRDNALKFYGLPRKSTGNVLSKVAR
jgi:predicted TIM-barrel fold metal-dependent hydrolase